MNDKDPRQMKPLSIHEIQVILADEIARLRAGETTAAKATAVANMTGKIMSSVRLELEYARLSGKAPKVAMLDEGHADA
jgi:hypothetical protein